MSEPTRAPDSTHFELVVTAEAEVTRPDDQADAAEESADQ